jgi:hypothetical protein
MALVLPRYVYDAGAGNVIIDFTECLAQTDKERIKANRKVTFGGTGIRQVNHKYNETIFSLVHEFVPESEIDLVSTMMQDWVLLGNTFDYYPDQTVTGTFTTVECLNTEFVPIKMEKKVDIWSFTLTVREEIS